MVDNHGYQIIQTYGDTPTRYEGTPTLTNFKIIRWSNGEVPRRNLTDLQAQVHFWLGNIEVDKRHPLMREMVLCRRAAKESGRMDENSWVTHLKDRVTCRDCVELIHG